jgi:DNA-directed RNA polymerase specialized sigma24 family protein
MGVQDDIAKRLDELVRLHALDVRRRSDNQVEAILELNRAGIGPSRIAEILGTTSNTVNVAIAREKRKSKKQPKKETRS